MMDSNDSFIRGWNYGKANGIERSARWVVDNFPDVEVPSFVSGMLDGIEGDRFRLELALGQTFLFV
jgi:hypothetical protein